VRWPEIGCVSRSESEPVPPSVTVRSSSLREPERAVPSGPSKLLWPETRQGPAPRGEIEWNGARRLRRVEQEHHARLARDGGDLLDG
jgi:hypothetical protein